MSIFLSKFLPLFVYPTGLITLFIILSLLFWKKRRLSLVFLITAFVVMLVAGNKYVAQSLTRTLEWKYPPLPGGITADAIVVLGGGTEPEISPRSMVEVNSAGDRVLYGIKLYQEGTAPVILLSGGDIDFWDESASSPAEDMATLMEQMGIPSKALVILNQSRNTQEDALFTCKYIKEHGLYKVLLVTSGFHMPRAMALFSAQGCGMIAAPTDISITEKGWEKLWHPTVEEFFLNLIPSYTHLSAVTRSLKEYYGMWYYSISGIL
jgi:uncharacterized SAM-binding protein YcdF (DUF218 family)